MGLGLSGLRLGLGQRGGGASVSVPVLSNFVDNLDQDPPNALFDSTEAGTLTWDFDASATPPAKGAGDIGTGTDSVTAGANDIDIDLTNYWGTPGYLHMRVTNGAGDSNILTSQQIEITRYNVLSSSNDFSTGSWAKLAGLTVTGTAGNQKLVQPAAQWFGVRQESTSDANTQTWSASVEAKAAECRYLNLQAQSVITSNPGGLFDLQTGVITSTAGSYTASSITDMGDGWYRCTVTGVITFAGAAGSIAIQPLRTTSANETGDGTSGLYVRRAQYEQGTPSAYQET